MVHISEDVVGPIEYHEGKVPRKLGSHPISSYLCLRCRIKQLVTDRTYAYAAIIKQLVTDCTFAYATISSKWLQIVPVHMLPYQAIGYRSYLCIRCHIKQLVTDRTCAHAAIIKQLVTDRTFAYATISSNW
jgi:hypothetical protein